MCQECNEECLDMTKSECVDYTGDDLSALNNPVATGQGINDVIESLYTQLVALQTWKDSVAIRSTLHISSVPVYADNAAALTGGLAVGDIYRKSSTDTLNIVH